MKAIAGGAMIVLVACAHPRAAAPAAAPRLDGVWTDGAHTATFYGGEYTLEVSQCAAQPCRPCVGQIAIGEWRADATTLTLHQGEQTDTYGVGFADGGAVLVLISTSTAKPSLRLRRQPLPALADTAWDGDSDALELTGDHYRLVHACDDDDDARCVGGSRTEAGTWRLQQELTAVVTLVHGGVSDAYEIGAYTGDNLLLSPIKGDGDAAEVDDVRPLMDLHRRAPRERAR